MKIQIDTRTKGIFVDELDLFDHIRKLEKRNDLLFRTIKEIKYMITYLKINEMNLANTKLLKEIEKIIEGVDIR